MHPPLSVHKHPHCAEIIFLFGRCIDEHPIAKFFGKCTDLKVKLDKCFREEKKIRQKASLEKSKRFRERFFATNAAVRAKIQRDDEEKERRQRGY